MAILYRKITNNCDICFLSQLSLDRPNSVTITEKYCKNVALSLTIFYPLKHRLGVRQCGFGCGDSSRAELPKLEHKCDSKHVALGYGTGRKRRALKLRRCSTF